MKKFHKKSLILLVCVTLLLTFTVSGTVAFLADNSDSVTNTFTPVEVDTMIKETVNKGTKVSIQVQNNDDTNHIPAYVRVSVSGYWVDQSGKNIVDPWNGVFELNDEPDTDAENNIANGKWVRSENYYYFTVPVAPGELTTNLLKSPIQGATKDNGDYLVINVVHQSIQAQPASAVTEAWGWTPPTSAQ